LCAEAPGVGRLSHAVHEFPTEGDVVCVTSTTFLLTRSWGGDRTTRQSGVGD